MTVATTRSRPAWLTVASLLAFIVLIVDVIFMAIGMIDIKIGLLIGGVALAEILPI